MKDSKIKSLAVTAVMSALMCVLGPISLPIGPVPISLTNFVILLSVYILGARRGSLSVLIYLLIGMTGVPVFSGFQGGFFKLAGPTGGYLIGFLPMALLAGIMIEKGRRRPLPALAGMIAAIWLDYLMGTLWLAASQHIDARAAFAAGVLPFIAWDLVKAFLALQAGRAVRSALSRAGLLLRDDTDLAGAQKAH